MAAIGFYHLTRSAAAGALPPLLGRTLAAGQRAVVRCGGEAQLGVIDQRVWEAAEWLPHGVTLPRLQPIWLTLADEAPNDARYLFLTDGVGSARLGAFERGVRSVTTATTPPRWLRRGGGGVRRRRRGTG